jgi:hypothetical protein
LLAVAVAVVSVVAVELAVTAHRLEHLAVERLPSLNFF